MQPKSEDSSWLQAISTHSNVKVENVYTMVDEARKYALDR